MSTVVAPSCPACERQGVAVALVPGASLDGISCPRCGGTHLPTVGSERLLCEELHLSRAALLELADAFGGRRFRCPGCSARTRALLVRGVDVDLCFACGGLWLEAGELEQLSDQRHRGGSVDRALARVRAPIATRPEASVRLDARAPARKIAGSVLRGTGLAAVIVSFALGPVGVVGSAALLGGAAAIAAGFGLRRRSVLDVFPRARRMLRSRRFMPALANDDDAVPLDDPCFVVVRPLLRGPRGGTLFAQAAYVDGVGRTLAPLGVGRVAAVKKTAIAVGRRLGAAVVVDASLGGEARAPRVPALCPTRQLRFARATSARTTVRFVAALAGGGNVVVENAVPARGDERGRSAFALCFSIAGPGGRVRLHDAGDDHVVVVDDAGDAIGVVGPGPGIGLTFAFSRHPRRVHAVCGSSRLGGRVFDDSAHVIGAIADDGGEVVVDVEDAGDADVTAAVVLAAAFAIRSSSPAR